MGLLRHAPPTGSQVGGSEGEEIGCSWAGLRKDASCPRLQTVEHVCVDVKTTPGCAPRLKTRIVNLPGRSQLLGTDNTG